MTAYGLINRPENFAGKFAIDDSDQGSLALIVQRKRPPGEDRGSSSAEIIRRDIELLRISDRIRGPVICCAVGEDV